MRLQRRAFDFESDLHCGKELVLNVDNHIVVVPMSVAEAVALEGAAGVLLAEIEIGLVDATGEMKTKMEKTKVWIEGGKDKLSKVIAGVEANGDSD